MSVEVMAGAPTHMTFSIMAGKSATEAHKVSGKAVGLILPTGWETATLTFQGGPSATTVADIYDSGVERSIASAQAVPGRLIVLSLNDWLCTNFLVIRSGTSASPVNQTARRDITVILAG